MDCFFCDELQKKIRDRKWYNEPLFETNNFIVMADRLPVAEYHYIIVSKKHFINVFDVIRSGLQQEMNDVLHFIVNKLITHNQDRIIIFEHGQKDEKSTNGGKSVSHFHLHVAANVVPTSKRLLDKYQTYIMFNSLDELPSSMTTGNDYLLITETPDTHVYIILMKDGIPSQYIRTVLYRTLDKKIAEEMGAVTEDGYNWKVYQTTITRRMFEEHKSLLISDD